MEDHAFLQLCNRALTFDDADLYACASSLIEEIDARCVGNHSSELVLMRRKLGEKVDSIDDAVRLSPQDVEILAGPDTLGTVDELERYLLDRAVRYNRLGEEARKFCLFGQNYVRQVTDHLRTPTETSSKIIEILTQNFADVMQDAKYREFDLETAVDPTSRLPEYFSKLNDAHFAVRELEDLSRLANRYVSR